MRTVDYSDLLRGSAGLAGQIYAPGETTSDVDEPAFRLFRTFHDRRLQVAWEIHRWPDLCPVEKRYYRQLYDSSATYTATDERFDLASGKYFQSLHAANTGNDPTTAGVENSAHWAESKNGYAATDWITGTAYAVGAQVRNPLTDLSYQVHTAPTAGATIDLTKMGLLTPFNKYIAYTQTGQTAIGEYVQATHKDPRITTQLIAYPFALSPDGAQFGPNAPNVLWLYYRIRRPELRGDVFDPTAVYTSGRQVYFVNATTKIGNFFTANTTTAAGDSPASEPTKWAVVELPYFLRGYLIEGGYADWLVGDGRTDEAGAHESFAQQFLELEADKLQRQQQQVRRLQAA
jgi:hypothetical protein